LKRRIWHFQTSQKFGKSEAPRFHSHLPFNRISHPVAPTCSSRSLASTLHEGSFTFSRTSQPSPLHYTFPGPPLHQPHQPFIFCRYFLLVWRVVTTHSKLSPFAAPRSSHLLQSRGVNVRLYFGRIPASVPLRSQHCYSCFYSNHCCCCSHSTRGLDVRMSLNSWILPPF
jgi:hypothetical protein